MEVAGDQGIDLMKLMAKGNAQVTEVQDLPGGLVYYAYEEESVEEQEPEQNEEKVQTTVLTK